VKIARGVEASDWTNLNLSSPDSPDWPLAISVFERRIRERFVEAAEFLIADDEKRPAVERRFGFAILTVNCLLIETLEAFRRGLTDTRSRSKELCTSFLTSRPAFKQFFNDALAERFYEEFRCGIAHHAQVFGSGRIWSLGPVLRLDGEQITVNRTAFHLGVLQELDGYLMELHDQNSTQLRQNFRDKMDFVAEGKYQRTRSRIT
jgi:hypothetical protein